MLLLGYRHIANGLGKLARGGVSSSKRGIGPFQPRNRCGLLGDGRFQCRVFCTESFEGGTGFQGRLERAIGVLLSKPIFHCLSCLRLRECDAGIV